MIVKPKIRGFICTTAHPEGCAENVKRQMQWVSKQDSIHNGPKRALVLGASTGYGLAARINLMYACNADTMGVYFERPGGGKRCASAGHYNAAALAELAKSEGRYARDINGDAFSDEIKEQVAEAVQKDWGQVDLVVYSLASPRRTHPHTGEVFNSVLKPIGEAVRERSLNTDTGEVGEVEIEKATEEEIEATVEVMGGDDWRMWMEVLRGKKLLAENCRTVAFTYIGKRITWPLYGNATIGAAKKHLDETAEALNQWLPELGGKAHIGVLKAVVTQASSAIPIMPLYLALLFKIMKEKGTHEGCIEQLYRLVTQIYDESSQERDEQGRLRCDGKELDDEVQNAVEAAWKQVRTENLEETTDIKGYREEFLKLFGFGFDNVDYEADVEL